MAQPQPTFTQWARTYNSRNSNYHQQADFFKDGFLWKLVILMGLGYLVWSDKFSMTVSLNDQMITGKSVKTSLLSLVPGKQNELPELSSFKLETGRREKRKEVNCTAKDAPRQEVNKLPDTEKTIRMKSYVDRFAPVAIAEMHRTGIPASIILAQGLLESNAGASGLAQKANNHFGMKCFSKNCWKGHCINYADDTHKDFFIKYSNAWLSFREHSEMLKKKPRYATLFHSSDYRQWATGLTIAGYATDQQYRTKLISLIQTLRLDQYDTH